MRIGLGTAQFGLDYGITNSAGRVSRDEVSRLLELAREHGVDILDTAPGYAASEEVLGDADTATFRIVTKTGKFGGLGVERAPDELRKTFETSLTKLRRDRIYGLLFHDSADLLGPLGDTLWSEMDKLQAQGLVGRIGASFYEGSEIDEALARYPLGIAQVPFNAMDPRLVHGGQLARLEKAGVEIHARSQFLQGLLLSKRFPAPFQPIADEVKRFEAVAGASGLTRLQGLLALSFQRTEISRFICGATNTEELRQILDSASVAERAAPPDYAPAPIDERILDPRRWSELSGS